MQRRSSFIHTDTRICCTCSPGFMPLPYPAANTSKGSFSDSSGPLANSRASVVLMGSSHAVDTPQGSVQPQSYKLTARLTFGKARRCRSVPKPSRMHNIRLMSDSSSCWGRHYISMPHGSVAATSSTCNATLQRCSLAYWVACAVGTVRNNGHLAG